jgi:transposase
MRKFKEILRLRHELGLTNRQIGGSCGISHVTVGNYLERAQEAGIGWPLPPEIEEADLEALVHPDRPPFPLARRPLPDFADIHRELRRKGVTRMLLWEEYYRDHPEGYKYTQFCEYYDRWRKTLEPTLRQNHEAGEKMFVDWAGQTVALKDPRGEGEKKAYLFVAVLGASNYTYAEAFENTKLPAWIDAHIHAFEYMGGVARLTVPDNTKTAVITACRYEPELNPTYRDLAGHYGTVILPTRPRKPRDKAKVETAVQITERRILAALRNRSFFSVAELNRSIRVLLEELNDRPFQKLPGSRRELFEELDKPALTPLPESRFEFCEWNEATAGIDYHVGVDHHFYSVPYRLTNQKVDVRLTSRMVEILHGGKRVASHLRSWQRGKFTTDPAHRPKSHQKHLEWTPRRLIDWSANQVGPLCARAVTHILETKPHPEQGYRSCLGIMRLAKSYGTDRVEAACRRALALEVCTYQSIKSILKSNLDRQPLPAEEQPELFGPTEHQNLRGRDYYNTSEEPAPQTSPSGGYQDMGQPEFVDPRATEEVAFLRTEAKTAKPGWADPHPPTQGANHAQ